MSHALRLVDSAARLTALQAHDRTLLVEAGAGSGKTAVLAGRIALLLADGAAPGAIAAVTFTELAASELMSRVREFVSRLLAGNVPRELQEALAVGLSDSQKAHLVRAEMSIEDITCSTIHGFCQRLITPYPAEASIDPGATVMDPAQLELAFGDIVTTWLREQLDTSSGSLLEHLFLADAAGSSALVHAVLGAMRRDDEIAAPQPRNLSGDIRSFVDASSAYSQFLARSSVKEPETVQCAAQFAELNSAVAAADPATPAGIVAILLSKPHSDLCKADGDFRQYRRKGKWEQAAKEAGCKSDGPLLAERAKDLHEACCDAWTSLLQAAASEVLRRLMEVLRPALVRLQEYKRSSAALDFDDLLRAARDLLRNHETVRNALSQRYRHVLVDEFQDTDPVQTEVFWRLCGDPPAMNPSASWRDYLIRPGSLFVVGDPKQAIYRFRGADVAAYVWARDALRLQDPAGVLSISVNFRSCASLLRYVNQRFEGPLSGADQPGFTTLDPFHDDRQSGPCLAALDVPVKEGANSRDAESSAIAKLCVHLISTQQVKDPHSGELRACRPGDIALLAPTGTELWRYEQALEDSGIAVSTQAGKGFFRRQEIQDLIAVTRVLADGGDNLALLALLRGPLVGLTEQQLLDLVWSLKDEGKEKPPTLELWVDADKITLPLAAEVFRVLQHLRKIATSTSPHNLLSQAVDLLKVRPALQHRYGRQAERAIANVDAYLQLSAGYDVRGLQAFSEAMKVAWEEESRAVEGRPDGQEEAVSLITMHAAKGLEWPVVIPINAMTAIKSTIEEVVDSRSKVLLCPVLGVKPSGYAQSLEREKQELQRERIRLWYVATTRARELLVVPRFADALPNSSWGRLVDLDLVSFPSIEVPRDVGQFVRADVDRQNLQTAEIFAEEAGRIASLSHQVRWLAPSRDEDVTKPVEEQEPAEIAIGEAGTQARVTPTAIQGGRSRGLVLHKLLEEVLNGEVQEDLDSLTGRAVELAAMLGCAVSVDPSAGLSVAEVAATALRALAIPAVAHLRPKLVPEYSVFSSTSSGPQEDVRTGFVDAIAIDASGAAQAVIDWKSDVEPDGAALEHYKAQVRAYLGMTGARRGLVVFATTGAAHEVVPEG